MTPFLLSHGGLEYQLSVIYLLSSTQFTSCLILGDDFNIRLLFSSPTILFSFPLSFSFPGYTVIVLLESFSSTLHCMQAAAWFQHFWGPRHIPSVHLCFQSRLHCTVPWSWMKHKLESSLLEEISITSDMQMTPPLWQKVKVKLLSHVRRFATTWTVAYQASPSMALSWQEYWSGLPFTSPQ